MIVIVVNIYCNCTLCTISLHSCDIYINEIYVAKLNMFYMCSQNYKFMIKSTLYLHLQIK